MLVSLPRHISGDVNPLRKYTPNNLCAPLVVSVRKTLSYSDDGDEDEDIEDSGFEQDESSPSSLPSRLSMSAFLDMCNRPVIVEDDDDDETVEEEPLPPEFETHFLAFHHTSSPPTLPNTCDVPVFVMAEDEQLPVLMSSLLYQRRVWHIDELLIGVGFSKYDTVIRIYLGWLDAQIPSGYALVSMLTMLVFRATDICVFSHRCISEKSRREIGRAHV